MPPKLNQIQIETIKQILSLRYSINIQTSEKLLPHTVESIQVNNVEEFIEQSIRKNILEKLPPNPKKIGISLSSGIDSTLVLALLRKEFPSCEIESISVKFHDSTDETTASKKIAEEFETNNHILEVNNILEELPKAISIIKQPFWDLHWYYLVKKMKSLTNVFLSGDGGDELFGGYTFRYKKFLDQTTENSSYEKKIISYLNCHERDWVPDQKSIFTNHLKFDWKEIHTILKPYFDNSLPRLSQVFLADLNGKLLFNMIPINTMFHNAFSISNITPIKNKELIKLSFGLSDEQKYDFKTNTGKLPLVKLLEKLNVRYLTSSKKQGFSVDTVNSWKSFGKKIFDYYFDKSRLIEDEIINNDWIRRHSENSDPSVRYVNKFLGILALEIWYRLFITKDLNENEKLTI
tara:strand:- start:2155 stop:3372 length:1218 start_codon:yes stop_codon:yes gene_type:complete